MDSHSKPPLALLIAGALLSSTYAQGQFNFNNNSSDENVSGAPKLEVESDNEDPNSRSLKERFSQAQPEDITNENFPEIIESFDFPNADITDVIKAISELTGRNFIVDSNVKGKVTIIAPSKITVAEAYKAFLSALASIGKTVVPAGKFWKIKDARAAMRDSIETYAGSYFPDAEQMITRIVKLKYISSKEVETKLRTIPTKEGDMRAYEPTNSLIITDFGSNIVRIMKIINELDVPGFEEKLAVINIRNAKSKEIADLVNKIINKDSGDSGSRFGRNVSRFARPGIKEGDEGKQESLSLVISDDRTNSIIVVGNQNGISKVRNLVNKLDFKIRPEDSGGVHVYYVKHGKADEIAKTLNGVAKEAAEAKKNEGSPASARRAFRPTPPGFDGGPEDTGAAVFGGEVQIAALEQTNSLIITASKQDYQVVKSLLEKIDIPRDQVFVKVVIMEMAAQEKFNYSVDYVNFDKDSNGVGRVGFRSGKSVTDLLNPAKDSGGVITLGSKDMVQLSSIAGTGTGVEVPTVLSFINFLQANTDTNILSTPQILALNNEEATIEVGAEVPVGLSSTEGANGQTKNSVERQKATIKLVITPYISPDSDTVRMKIQQQVRRPTAATVTGADFADAAIAMSERAIDTSITANDGDTVVLGGLIEDVDEVVVSKVPILGDIPILGWFFRARSIEKNKRNLVVFISPKIIRSGQDSGDVLTDKLNERIDFIQAHMKGRDPHGSMIDQLPRKASLDPGEKIAPEEPEGESF